MGGLRKNEMGSTVERMLRVLTTIDLMNKNACASTSAAEVGKVCTYNQNSTRAYITWLRQSGLVDNSADKKNFRVTELGRLVLVGEMELRTNGRTFLVRQNSHKGTLRPVEVVKREPGRLVGGIAKPPPVADVKPEESIITPWDPKHSMVGHAYHRRPKT